MYKTLCLLDFPQENAVDWFPTDTNTAGDLILGSGSKFVQAVETARDFGLDRHISAFYEIYRPAFYIWVTAVGVKHYYQVGPNAAVATEDVVYWMGIDNFYVYSGQTQQLECTVKDHAVTDLNLSQTDKVYGGINSSFLKLYGCTAPTQIQWLMAVVEKTTDTSYTITKTAFGITEPLTGLLGLIGEQEHIR